MDFKRFIIIFTGLTGAIYHVQASPLPSEISWLDKNADIATIINSRPVECINPDIPISDINSVSLGRLAFESPALLGGQSARMGLSCSSCHLSARDNIHFHIANISDLPGTADVTENFLSSSGGNNIFTPVKIPDLADIVNMKIPARDSALFKQKLIQLITVEFDGQYPSDKILSAIQLYLQNINFKYCKNPSKQIQLSWVTEWKLFIDALDLIEVSINRNDSKTLDFLVRAARLKLQIIFNRYGIVQNTKLNNILIATSRKLQDIVASKNNSKHQMLANYSKVKSYLKPIKNLLIKVQNQSAYNISALNTELSNN